MRVDNKQTSNDIQNRAPSEHSIQLFNQASNYQINDPLTQTQILAKFAEFNLLDREVHADLMPITQIPKQIYKHDCLDTVRTSENDAVNNTRDGNQFNIDD